MEHDEKIRQLSDDLQVLAFNLADTMDTLNFHSNREAVRDLNRRAGPMADEMMQKIRSLVYNLDNEKPGDFAEDIEEARDMYSLLDLTRKCSVESENFKNFVDSLIPLIEKLDEWGRLGAPPRQEGFSSFVF